MISFCVPFYPWYRSFSREEEIFNVLIPSLNDSEGVEDFELCIADGGREDIWDWGRVHDSSEFKARITCAFKGEVKFTDVDQISVRGKYRRWGLAKSINLAVELSTRSRLFIVGIDVCIPKDFSTRYQSNVGIGKSWVVIAAGLKRVADIPEFYRGGIPARWNPAKGIVGIMREDFYSIGGYHADRFIKDHSDSNFYNRMVEHGFEMKEGREPGFFHINHPGSHFVAKY